MDVGRLRGAASGGALPPEPPAGALPLDPKMMWSHGEMTDADGSVVLSHDVWPVCLGITESCTDAFIMRQT